MNGLIQKLQSLLGPHATAIKALMAPVFIIMVLSMMVLPLPAFALDMLFTFNIAMALMVMMVAAYMVKPLDFSAFPTVILLTTLLRLSLNIASTRVVLLDGHTGPGAAGKVIESFGHFLIGGNFAVGLIVFAILVVINFVVVTKGAERIAEVGARFTLDAMPGKQMAIDADLNAGLIDEKEAKRRRAEVGNEAEFFGSMDGASKFVRGDAMAGLLILFINIIGGFVIGVAQHDLSASQAAMAWRGLWGELGGLFPVVGPDLSGIRGGFRGLFVLVAGWGLGARGVRSSQSARAEGSKPCFVVWFSRFAWVVLPTSHGCAGSPPRRAGHFHLSRQMKVTKAKALFIWPNCVASSLLGLSWPCHRIGRTPAATALLLVSPRCASAGCSSLGKAKRAETRGRRRAFSWAPW